MKKIYNDTIEHITKLQNIARAKTGTLRFKILASILLLVFLLMSVIGVFFYLSMSRILFGETNKEFLQMQTQMNTRIESQLDMIDSSLQFFMLNPTIKAYLQDNSNAGDSYTQAMKKINIEKQLSYLLLFNYLWDSGSIRSVYIFQNQNNFYHIDRDSSPSYAKNNTKIYSISSKTADGLQIFPPSSSDRTVYFVRNLKDEYSLDYTGTIIVGIDVKSLLSLYNDALQYQNAQAFIYDSNKTIILSKDMNLLGKKLSESYIDSIKKTDLDEAKINGTSYYVASKLIQKYGWTSTIMIPKNQIFSKLSGSFSIYIEVILIILLVFLLLGVFVSSRLVRPIRNLMDRIELMREGNFTVKMPSYKDLELNQLSVQFNKMTDEIQYLINDVYKKQLLLKESELKSLQSQINPHFLFNVLDTVSWHARAAKNDEINNIITPLGRILRANIVMGSREKVKIDEELQYVEFYLSIQKSRFGDRLQTQLNLEDAAIRDYYIPKLCIQPIVENAIVHGLEEKISDGILAVNIFQELDTVVFEIIDNGVGFNQDDIDLNDPEHVLKTSEKRTNIGLYNANKRIRLLYGEKYGIFLESKIGEGTRVTVKIPVDLGGI